MKTTAHTKYPDYYHLEKYLFNDVSGYYQKHKTISAFDFFCIIIWKANRSKPRLPNVFLHKDIKIWIWLWTFL